MEDSISNPSPSTKKCPRCGTEARELVRIDAGMRISLVDAGHGKEVPTEACTNCINEFSQMVSQGAKLRAQRKAREANITALWRNRINVLKQARTYLAQRVYAEAAIEFEKYLRTLEVVNEAKPGALSPEMFKGGKKSAEIDVVLSVLWDLIKIYDMNPSYQNKLKERNDMFALFAKSAPNFPRLARKMWAHVPKARNKQALEELLKRCNAPRARCFIASSAYGNPQHPDVLVLSSFRDNYLVHQPWGLAFTEFYNLVSPKIAVVMDILPISKPIARLMLQPFIKWLKKNSA